MNYEYSEWTQIRVTVRTPFLDRLTAIMSVVDINLMIEDYSDFNLHGMYGELADDSILNADRTVASVSVFFPASESPDATLAFIRDRMAAAGIEGQIDVTGLSEADWVNNWKQYYKPLHIGKRTVIVPKWEEYTPADGEICVRMDPGMAFGTGSHETTRSILEMLEENVRPGDSVLDVGTGSGILGICAMKLGAGSCRAYDIDPIAAEVAAENFAENGLSAECGVSDLLSGVREGTYDIICANIVADIILRMLPEIGAFMTPRTQLFLSGIIAERASEVEKAVAANGLTAAETRICNGWAAIRVTLPRASQEKSINERINPMKQFKKRFIIVSGPVCSGKTTLALNIAKNSGNCFYFDKDDLVRTSMATFKAVDTLLPANADIPYDRESIRLSDRHGQFFKDFIRNPEYDSTRDVIIKGIQFSNLVIVNAPYTSELKKEAAGDCPAFDTFHTFFEKEDVEFMVVFVHVTKEELKKRLKQRESDPVAALRDKLIYQDIDKYLAGENVEPPIAEGQKLKNVDRFFVFETGDDAVRDASYAKLMDVLGIKDYAPYDRKIQVNAVES